MILIKSFLCLGLLLLFVVSADAQDDRLRVGFGVGISRDFPIGIIGIGGVEEDLYGIAMPVDFANFTFILRITNIRFEPNLGFYTYSRTATYSEYETDLTISNWRLGAVIASANAIGSMNFYYGIDFGVILSSFSSDLGPPYQESEDGDKTDFFVGPTIGGEYMFGDNFSLGGEIQINYISIGQFNNNSQLDVTEYAISTRGLIILRWYVN